MKFKRTVVILMVMLLAQPPAEAFSIKDLLLAPIKAIEDTLFEMSSCIFLRRVFSSEKPHRNRKDRNLPLDNPK